MLKYFYQSDLRKYRGYAVILDVDGTLLAEGETIVGEKEKSAVAELAQNNAVYIFSNNRSKARAIAVAAQVGRPYLRSPYRKPNKKIVRSLPDAGKPVLVIGDKYLTDVRFARRVKAEYLLVRSLKSRHDRWLMKIFNLADRIACRIMAGPR